MISHEHPNNDPAELAALYAAGAMPPEDAAEFEAHLDAGCKSCVSQLRELSATSVELFSAITPEPVDPRIRSELMARMERRPTENDNTDSGKGSTYRQIWRNWPSDQPEAGISINWAADCNWESTGIDGIEIRRLFVDRPRNQMTAMIRMAAGTSYPRHIHDGPEECLVLQGDLRLGNRVFHAGDYHRMEPGSKHEIQSTDNGCELLIVSSLTDEIV